MARHFIPRIVLGRIGRLPVPLLLQAACSFAAVGAMPMQAAAHVKWFAPYDVAQPPQRVPEILDAHFLLVLGGFVLMMIGGFMLDRLLAARGYGAAWPAWQAAEEKLLRAGTGAFFMALFTMGGVLLTPELTTTAEWTAWLQFGIAASLISPATCILGGLGILVLYGCAVAQYGVFHLTDYPVFIGLAAYLVLTSARAPGLRALRMPILYVTVCGSLMWIAIEKFAYPQWTYPLLDARPYLAMGMPREEFMVAAGFVEFALAFYILTGLGLLRLAILGLGAIFVAAILEFGKLDAIGHLPIIVALGTMLLHGPTAIHRWVYATRPAPLLELRRTGLSFLGAICMFFATYYGLQHAEHGAVALPERAALLQPLRQGVTAAGLTDAMRQGAGA